MDEIKVFRQARFHTSVAALAQLPPDAGVEIAFAGRSNSGKSSAINALANRRQLAFASKTPGRTQLINFFSLGEDRYLVDLPGYGYAQVPSRERRGWDELISGYLGARVALCGLVVLMDARRPLQGLDEQLLDWFAPSGKRVHVLLSKADKLSRSDQACALRDTRRSLMARGENYTAQLFSTLAGIGLEEAAARMAEILGIVPGAGDHAPKKKPPG